MCSNNLVRVLNNNFANDFELERNIDKKIIDFFSLQEVNVTIQVIDGVKCFHFKYDSIMVDWGKNAIAKQCRGHVLYYSKEAGSFKYLVRPFDKFYNINEAHCTFRPEKISLYKIKEKVDGTCILLWKNITGDIHISTLGRVYNESFEQLFYATLKKSYGIDKEEFHEFFADYLNSGHTIIFELAALENMIVTYYGKDIVALIAIRHNDTGEYKEIPYYYAFFKRVTEIACKDIEISCSEDLVSWVESYCKKADSLGKNPEGFVVYDGLVPIAKIKNINYILLHKFRSSIGTPRITTMVSFAIGTLDDVISVWPNTFSGLSSEMHRGLTKIIDTIFTQSATLELSGAYKRTRKEYALAVQRFIPEFFHSLFYQVSCENVTKASIKKYIIDYILKYKENNKRLKTLESLIWSEDV